MSNLNPSQIAEMFERTSDVVSRGSLDDLRHLIKEGLDPSDRHQGTSLLQYFLFLFHDEDSKIEALKELIKAVDTPKQCQSDDGITSLMTAISVGSYKMARTLIEHGDDANAVKEDGTSVVHIAAAAGDQAIRFLELLDQHGAKMDVVNESTGVTALMNACDNDDATRWLLDRLPHLLESADVRGYTPLMHAVEVGAPSVVEVYLGRGANLHARGIDEMTAMDLAKQEGHWGVLKRLQAFDSAVKARNLMDQIAQGAQFSAARRMEP